jgi:hypothetical protein
MSHCYTVSKFKRGKFDVVVSWTHEDTPLDMLFDDGCYDINELAQKIDSGLLDYFIARVQFFYHGTETGSAHIGGFLYEDVYKAFEEGLDGCLEDMVISAEADSVIFLSELKENLAKDFSNI